jgi:hypothetical protein
MTEIDDRTADAVRYLVLRKLAAGMRHTLLGELQTIQFAADLAGQMVKRDVTGSPLGDAVNRISEQTRHAAITSRSIMEWLRPEDGSSMEVESALEECVSLASEVWILRGIKAATTCRAQGARVSKSVFLETVVTALLALTDTCPGSLDVGVNAERADRKVSVRLDARSSDRMSAQASTLHRALTLEDVTLLAEANAVSCVCSEATITLEFQQIPG